MSKSKKAKPFAVKKQLSPEQWALLKKVSLHATVVAVLLLAGVVGFKYLKRYVDRRVVFYDHPPRIVLKNKPAWMSDYLADQIISSAKPLGAHSTFDHQLLVDVGDCLKNNAWIRDVKQVRRAYTKQPGDTIEVDCDYRAPLALVHWKDYYWMVDSEGVKLPEQFTEKQLPQVVYGRDNKLQFRVIEGVHNPPVESGQNWPGEDLVAALELARYLYGQPYADEVAAIDVSNFAGRESAKDAQLVLVTKRGSEIRWGRPVKAKDFFVEVSVAQKLSYMERVWKQYGRVDANQPWIDIRFDKITYPSATAGTEGPSHARIEGGVR